MAEPKKGKQATDKEKKTAVAPVAAGLPTPLSVDEERFCREYVSTNIAVTAALRVWPNLSYDVAGNKAGRLLRNAQIIERIRQLTEEYKERYSLTEDKILKKFAALANFDRRCMYNADGTPKHITELTEEEAYAITEVETTFTESKGRVTKVKFVDPKSALEMTGKHFKMWNEVGSKNNPLSLVTLTDAELDARLEELKAKG